MSFSLIALNLKGIDGLFSGVLRCYAWVRPSDDLLALDACKPTTLRESLRVTVETWNERLWNLAGERTARVLARSTQGANLDDMIGDG